MLKADETSGNTLFEEKQRFPGWLNILIIGITMITIAIILIAGLTGPKEERNQIWIALVIAIPIEIFIIFLFRSMCLEKIVTSNGLYFRWMTWQRRFRVIEKENIKSFEVRNTPPLNYGIHWFPGYGWVHNASGGQGLQFYLVNGNRVFLGTADIDSFAKAMNTLINRSQNQVFSEH